MTNYTIDYAGTQPADDIRVRQRNDGTVRLPEYVGGSDRHGRVIVYLNGRNAEVSSSTATADSSGFAELGAPDSKKGEDEDADQNSTSSPSI